MRYWKRFGSLLVSIGGMLGIVLCVAGVIVAWSIASRLGAINDLAHDGVDKSAAVVRERVLDAQTHVAESKLTSENIRQGLADWAKKAAAEHVAIKLDVQTKADRLASGLARVDRYVELAASSVESIQRTTELAAKLGVGADAASIDPMRDRLAAIRTQLQQATANLAEIRRRVAEVAVGGPLGEGWHQVIQLALRIVATVGELDDRLAETAAKLLETQSWARQSKATVHAWIIAGQSAVTAVLAWLAVGQASLCVHGWQAFRHMHGEPAVSA